MTERVACPVCNEKWPALASRCFCGYDFENRNPHDAIERLSSTRKFAWKIWRRGVAMICALPLTFGAAFVLGGAFFIPLTLLSVLQLGIGSALVWGGLSTGHASGKRLAAARALQQLPAARVVK